MTKYSSVIRPSMVFAIGIIFTMSAYAQGGGPGMGMGMGRNMPTFSEYDLNGDGKIVEQEFNEARAKRMGERAQQGFPMRNAGNAPAFKEMDQNGDGALSAEEFAAHQKMQRGRSQ